MPCLFFLVDHLCGHYHAAAPFTRYAAHPFWPEPTYRTRWRRPRCGGTPYGARPGNGLTDRETEIIRYLCYGRTKQYIAETMSLSENTIRTYARRAYLKLGIHTRQELQDLVWGAV